MKSYSFKDVETLRKAMELGKEIYNDIFNYLPDDSEFFVVIVDTVVNEEIEGETVSIFKTFMKANAIMNNHEYTSEESVEVYCISTSTEESLSMYYKLQGEMNYGRWACCGSSPIEPSGVRRLFDNRATVKVYF